jgi:error-prone DNA polymerase
MYPKRLLLSEARRLGVKILPLDVNKSKDEYLVEKTIDGTGIRMAITDLHGISNSEISRIIKQAPFVDLADFYLRASPSRATIKRLALVGALDELAGGSNDHTRGDILERVRELTSLRTKPKLDQNQPMLDFEPKEQMPSGFAQISAAGQIQAELDLLGMDITDHQLAKYQPMLDQMGVVRSSELVSLRSKTDVLIAGVRVATQSPPMRSGKRVVFITLDDGTGCSDATFFDEAQARSSGVLFNTKLMLISGKTRRTGVKGVSIMAENAWDLNQLWREYRQKNQLIAVEN